MEKYIVLRPCFCCSCQKSKPGKRQHSNASPNEGAYRTVRIAGHAEAEFLLLSNPKWLLVCLLFINPEPGGGHYHCHLLSGCPTFPARAKGKRSIPETTEACVLQQEELSSQQSLTAKQLQALPLPLRKQPNWPCFGSLGISKQASHATTRSSSSHGANRRILQQPLEEVQVCVPVCPFIDSLPVINADFYSGWSS